MKRTVFFVVPFSSTVVLLMNVFWRVSSRSWDQCNAWHRWAPDRRTASTYSSQTQSRKMKHRLHNSPLHTRGGGGSWPLLYSLCPGGCAGALLCHWSCWKPCCILGADTGTVSPPCDFAGGSLGFLVERMPSCSPWTVTTYEYSTPGGHKVYYICSSLSPTVQYLIQIHDRSKWLVVNSVIDR